MCVLDERVDKRTVPLTNPAFDFSRAETFSGNTEVICDDLRINEAMRVANPIVSCNCPRIDFRLILETGPWVCGRDKFPLVPAKLFAFDLGVGRRAVVMIASIRSMILVKGNV